MEELCEPIIIDNGSHKMVVGFDQGFTRQVQIEFPTVVGSSKKQGTMIGMGKPIYKIGEKAIGNCGFLAFSYPYEKGKIINWEDMERIWRYSFFQELRVMPEEHPVILTESAFVSPLDRQKTTEIMFETFNVPLLYLANKAAMSLYDSDQRITGLVVEMGEDLNYVVPVYQGSCMRDYVQASGVGGAFLTSHLIQILINLGHNYSTKKERKIIEDIKEKHGVVSPLTKNSQNIIFHESGLNIQNTPLNKDKNNKKKNETIIKHELPLGNIIDLNEKVVFVTKPLFYPKLVKIDEQLMRFAQRKKAFVFNEKDINWKLYEKGIHEIVFDTIQSLPLELHDIMFQNIVLAGGNSMFKGMRQRLINELELFYAENQPQINVMAPNSRKYSSFLGCKKLSQLSNFSDYCVSRFEYDEIGSKITNRKIF
ncbi:actin-5c-like protein [Anaeramoeba flamelloides]|uniref:Actin-5c-like protein n=1 Tax=Anaeramoeba flamelloides TaxID=1746091 RepID=A0ABQ8Z9L8_9EUKA|nr:actin-5c-like protein [Anaeramoeba flamelloides]